MLRKRETRPSRQARERASESNAIVSQEAIGGAILIGLVIFAVLVAPHLMYDYIAPLKGWI